MKTATRTVAFLLALILCLFPFLLRKNSAGAGGGFLRPRFGDREQRQSLKKQRGGCCFQRGRRIPGE